MRGKENVAIIGGAGNMGRLTADLFQRLGFNPVISDPRLPESPTPKEAIQRARIVFFSVLPLEEINRIVAETEGDFEGQHIVLDNASLKEPLLEAFTTLNERGVSICSTHPLCKHDQPLHGQKAILMDVGQNPAKAHALAERLYRNAGMITVPLSLEEHDRAMTIVQLVPHLVMRSVAQALEKTGVNMQSIQDIAPANFQLFNLALWRTLVQDPRISATLITHLLNREEGEMLAKNIQDGIAQLVADKDEKSLSKSFGKTVSELDKDGHRAVMNQTTTIILERLANLGVRSIVIETSEDRAGLLREVLLPFEDHGISLTAIDSHKSREKLRFEIGIDEETISPSSLFRTLKALEERGFQVSV